MLLGKSKNGWELHTIANGHLSCENSNLLPDDIDVIEQILRPKFVDIMKKEDIMVSYDNWSGVFIMQNVGMKTGSSDTVIKEIYEFLANSNL